MSFCASYLLAHFEVGILQKGRIHQHNCEIQFLNTHHLREESLTARRLHQCAGSQCKRTEEIGQHWLCAARRSVPRRGGRACNAIEEARRYLMSLQHKHRRVPPPPQSGARSGLLAKRSGIRRCEYEILVPII